MTLRIANDLDSSRLMCILNLKFQYVATVRLEGRALTILAARLSDSLSERVLISLGASWLARGMGGEPSGKEFGGPMVIS